MGLKLDWRGFLVAAGATTQFGWELGRAARVLSILSIGYARPRPAKAIRDGRDT